MKLDKKARKIFLKTNLKLLSYFAKFAINHNSNRQKLRFAPRETLPWRYLFRFKMRKCQDSDRVLVLTNEMLWNFYVPWAKELWDLDLLGCIYLFFNFYFFFWVPIVSFGVSGDYKIRFKEQGSHFSNIIFNPNLH